MTSLEGDDGTLGPWIILGWLLPFSLEPPDDDDSGSDFSRVMKVMNSYAEKMDSALFESSEVDALAGLLQAVARVPAVFLSGSMARAGRLKVLRVALDFASPERHLHTLRSNFTAVQQAHPNITKWTGSGHGAFSHSRHWLPCFAPARASASTPCHWWRRGWSR